MIDSLPTLTEALLERLSPGVSLPSLAYLGPGGAVSAIGAVLAAVAGILFAILGFLWYPIKRLLRKRPLQSRREEDDKDA